MSNTPKIRFAGFTENWEQHKLGDLGSVAMCRRIFKEQTMEVGEIPFYKIGTFGNHADAYISRELFEEYKSKYPYPQKGDILVSASGSIGRTVEYTGKDEYFQDSNIVWLMHDERLENSFLKYFYQVVEWSGLEGSTIKRLYNSNILRTKIMLPSSNDSDEQKLIGALMATLDKLIDHHQHKHEKLISLKAACLDKMFPKNGSKTPELRFSGFVGNWKQSKFSVIFDILQNNTLSRAELSLEGGVAKNVHYGDVLVKFGEYLNVSQADLPYIVPQQIVDKLKGSLLQNGDVVMADTAEDETVGKCSEISGMQTIPIIAGLHTIPMRPKIKFASGYLGYYMNSDAYHDQLLPLMQGIKVTSVSKGAIQDTIISFPADIAEQAAIGQYFIRLDNLINLHQRKLKKLKQLRQSMLHNMFV